MKDEPLPDSLVVDDTSVWVRSGDSRTQGWEFRPAHSPPVLLSGLSPLRYRLDFIDRTQILGAEPSMIEDAVTGKEVFRLSGRYVKPTAAR